MTSDAASRRNHLELLLGLTGALRRRQGKGYGLDGCAEDWRRSI